MSAPRASATFGWMLREHRLAAGLTQEALSEQSGVSPRTIQQLEADVARPRRATIAYLADALQLTGAERDVLVAAARPAARQPEPTAAGRTMDRHGASTLLAAPSPAPPAETDSIPHLVDDVDDRQILTFTPAAPTNVPWPVSSLLGREADLASLRKLIATDRQRLVTLLGVGGSGKTRLAIQAAADLLETFPDGVWFVELAPVTSPALVARSVAGALGVREVHDVPILDSLLGQLRRKRLLLVLDNCEHLIDGCAALTMQLVAACPDLHILATSREPLQIAGERRYQVRPLAVPKRNGSTSFAALMGTPAVRLFVERAQAIDAEFTPTETNVDIVAQICARLDGIPLAIELAASRIGVLTVEEIAEGLADGFRLLSGGRRAGPSRQQTMQAALGWSYELLADDEQAGFRALSTFAGGFELEAAEQVMGDGEWVIGGGTRVNGDRETRGDRLSPITHHPSLNTLDVLGRLVDKSLVVAEQTPRGRRYRLLEPVRQYARRMLMTGGEADSARARHAAHYAGLAARVAPMLRGPDQISWLERLETERDNLRAALGWLAERGAPDERLRLAVALTPFWEARGYLSDGRYWLDAMLAAPETTPARQPDPGNPSRGMRMRALMSAGLLAQWQADLDRAEILLAEALAIAQELGDRQHEAEVLAWQASACWQEQADERGLALCEQSLELAHALADERLIAFAQFNLGVGLRFTRQTARAVTILNECLSRYRALGDVRSIAIASAMLGWATFEAGQLDRASSILHGALRDLRAVGDQRFIRSSIRALAQIAHRQNEARRAVLLFSAGEAMRLALGMRQTERERAGSERLLASLREKLPAPDFEVAYAAGETMSLDAVLAEIAPTR